VTLALFGMRCVKFVGELNVNGWLKLILFMVTLMLTLDAVEMLSCIVVSAVHHPSNSHNIYNDNNNNNYYYNNNNNINKHNNSSNKTQITTTFY
jgi:hypothetical protein